MKKIIAILMVIAMVLGLAACGGSSAPAASTTAPAASTPATTTTQAPAASTEPAKLLASPLTFKLCFTENPDTAIGTLIPAAAEKVTELTNGEINFEICPSAQLGANPDVMEQLINGAPVITAAGYDNMSAFVPACNVPCTPYVFESIDEIFKYGTTDAWQSMKSDIIAAGYQPICLGSWGLRCFISSKKITCADDIKGLIVRMGNSAASQNFVTVMGGSPTTSAWADNYSLIQNGTIDACEAPVDLLWSSSLYEVCDYLCLSNHLATPGMFVISPDFWAQIPAEYQAIMEETFGKAMEDVATEFKNSQADYVAKFKEAGTEVCENPDVASFAAYVPKLFDYLGYDVADYEALRAAVEN